jgi:hypothetical protein
MGDILLVEKVDGREKLAHDMSAEFFTMRLAFHYIREKLSASAELIDHVISSVVFKHLINLDYVWVLQRP